MEEEKKKKNPVKTIKTIAIILLVVIVFVCIYIYFTQWPIRYSSKLDDFFGEGNWEVISQEKKESNAYVEHHTDSNGYSYDTPGTYRE